MNFYRFEMIIRQFLNQIKVSRLSNSENDERYLDAHRSAHLIIRGFISMPKYSNIPFTMDFFFE